MLRLKRLRRSSSAEAMETEGAIVAQGEEDEAGTRAYYSQSPGGSGGTITLPAHQGWTSSDLEHASTIGKL